MNKLIAPSLAAALVAVVPVSAQMTAPGQPGAADPSRIVAGNYTVDANHTQVVWSVNHLGISPLSGSFGASDGTLELDPAKPTAAKVSVTFKTAEMSTNAAAFTHHLEGADFFDIAKFPTMNFTSTGVQVTGKDTLKIVGNLTIKGITKPVTIDAKFYGAGINPQKKHLQIGFQGNASIKRSEFGLGYALPIVGDEVILHIHAAFDKAA